MKIGKVFEKLAARPAVEAIRFYKVDGTESATAVARCGVFLHSGYQSNGTTDAVVKTAHEARLFIDAAKLGATAPAVEQPAPAFVQPGVPVEIQLALESAVASRVEERKVASGIRVEGAWVAAACQANGIPVPANCNGEVLVTPRTLAALIVSAAA